MPPVFGPLSPSNARLWSCADASGSAVSPSHSAKNEASSPARNSSMTTSAPAVAQAAAEHHVDRGFGLGDVSATITPLPAASPSALTTIGAPLRAHIGLGLARGAEALIGRCRYACRPAQILGEALGAFELRRGAARAEGLDAGGFQIVHDAGAERRFRADHDEIDAVVRGKTRSPPRGRRRRARRTPPHARCRHCRGRRRAGPVSGLAAIFQASACSRPPEPRSRMFIG